MYYVKNNFNCFNVGNKQKIWMGSGKEVLGPFPIFLNVSDFAEKGFSLSIEYCDSIKGRLSNSYLVIGQV